MIGDWKSDTDASRTYEFFLGVLVARSTDIRFWHELTGGCQEKELWIQCASEHAHLEWSLRLPQPAHKNYKKKRLTTVFTRKLHTAHLPAFRLATTLLEREIPCAKINSHDHDGHNCACGHLAFDAALIDTTHDLEGSVVAPIIPRVRDDPAVLARLGVPTEDLDGVAAWSPSTVIRLSSLYDLGYEDSLQVESEGMEYSELKHAGYSADAAT